MHMVDVLTPALSVKVSSAPARVLPGLTVVPVDSSGLRL